MSGKREKEERKKKKVVKELARDLPLVAEIRKTCTNINCTVVETVLATYPSLIINYFPKVPLKLTHCFHIVGVHV